jgi:hypothetical protein
MSQVRKGVREEEINQSAQHILYVEGENESFDPKVLRVLLEEKIDVKPFGPSSSIRSVAEAFRTKQPSWYFLVDRDHFDDRQVEESWQNFANPEKSNLLIWKRRQIENYFLDPSYLCLSKYCQSDEAVISDNIRSLCKKRVFIDAANLVIIIRRETLKSRWIEKFRDPDQFKTKDDAIKKLKDIPEIPRYKTKVSEVLKIDELVNDFEKTIIEITGGNDELVFGAGRWVELLEGKGIFSSISDQCFRVLDLSGKSVSGKEKCKDIAKDLLRKPLENQPNDFKELYSLINKKLQSN